MNRIKIAFLVFMVNTISSYTQEFLGVATYQSKTNIDFESDSIDLPKENLDAFKEMIKQEMEKEYILTFNKFESIFKEEEKLEQPNGGMQFKIMGGFDQSIYYKNLKEKIYIQQIETFSKDFLIKDTLKVFQWTLENESKMIGEHLCFKATTTKKIDIDNFETNTEVKDSNQLDDTKSKNIIITAWYTPDIPINNGPNEYWGLPGLILELTEENTVILCSELKLYAKDVVKIVEPTKGKVVTQSEYDKIIEDKIKEMNEMYNNSKKGDDDLKINIKM